ncbi:MAG: apolipoprotein N-acyltransferase [Planctomycetes bacterium]|nr:apolipoprotein N-acyltransferase [Planctomycetota bacterium]
MLLIFLRGTAILLGALALAASWLYVQAFAAAWLGMILLFAAVAGLSRRKAFAAGFLFGLIYMIVALQWAPHMLAITLDCDEQLLKPWLVFVAIAAWEAIPFAVISSVAASAAERAIPCWACASGWIVMERFWPRVFPWSFAHTQIDFPPMVQAAELGGMYLVSFVFVYACLDIGVRMSRKDFAARLVTCVPLLLVVLCLTFGWFRLASLNASLDRKETIRVGVVQVDPSYVDSMKKMRVASEQFPPVDLLVWPESTLGSYSSAVAGLNDIRKDIKVAHMPFLDWKQARGLNTWLLVGGKTFEPGAGAAGPYYQTAYLIDTEGVFRGRYHKRELMPIGEYMPLEQTYPELHDWAQLSKQAAWGTSDAPLQASGGVRIGALLCYEDIVAEMSRRSVANGAELLVSLINASAFEDSLALNQHLRLATLRSVENRRTLIRCSGTGVSCCIDLTGKLVTHVPPNTEGQFVVEAQLNKGRTIYNRFGYLFPHLAAVALGVLALKTCRP